MQIRIGPPVTGDNFYKRPHLIAKLRRALKRGNVAFLGPRRTGKSSCLEEIHATSDDYLTILLNLEEIDTVEDWISIMIRELRVGLEKPQSNFSKAKDQIASLLGNLSTIELPTIGKVEIASNETRHLWREKAGTFLKLLEEANVPILFLLDEFPTFLKLVATRSSRDEVESVLNWFRAARNNLKDNQIRFLVTGSIGLKGVVKKFGLAPTVNEFDTHEIPPFEEQEALGLLKTLAADNDLKLTAANRKKILELIGANWPVLLQLFVSEIEEAGLTKAPSSKDLEDIYRDKLVHGSRNQYCEGMYDRLKEIFGATEAMLAREILKRTCRSSEGLRRDDYEEIHAVLFPEPTVRALIADELDHVLDTLKHDGYLLQKTTGEKRTCFGSNILRDFWIRKTA